LEAPQDGLVVHPCPDELQGDRLAFGGDLIGEPHLAHAALAQPAHQFEAVLKRLALDQGFGRTDPFQGRRRLNHQRRIKKAVAAPQLGRQQRLNLGKLRRRQSSEELHLDDPRLSIILARQTLQRLVQGQQLRIALDRHFRQPLDVDPAGAVADASRDPLPRRSRIGDGRSLVYLVFVAQKPW
jgi:hypothetical protein